MTSSISLKMKKILIYVHMAPFQHELQSIFFRKILKTRENTKEIINRSHTDTVVMTGVV